MSTLFEDAAERFQLRMRHIILNVDDVEERHIKMDELMCETLEGFGCHAGVELFKEAAKWYG